MKPSRTTETANAGCLRRLVMPHGNGAFLKGALGIYITPQPVLDAIEDKKPFVAKPLLGNPPWSRTGLTADKWAKAAAYCGFKAVKDYRNWLANLKREMRHTG